VCLVSQAQWGTDIGEQQGPKPFGAWEARQGAMALKGNLRDFNLTQLLNLINLSRKTGTLSIEATGQQAQICFKEGKLVFASLDTQDGHLAQVLYKAGQLSQEQTRTILSRAGATSDKRLGMMLIEAGHVTHTRRVKEWEELQDELPDLDATLRFTDRPDARLRNINLSVEEWRVVSFINPRNSIRQIAKANNMSDFQIRRIIYGMLQAGLVDLIRPEGTKKSPAPRRGQATTAPTRTRRPPSVKRSVVERLISRIKRL